MRTSFDRRSGVPILLLASALFLDCAPLRPIAADACGNGVVDANEDCDSFPESCGRATDGARACRLTCDPKAPSTCPAGWGCSVDAFCRQATGEFGSAGAASSAGVVTLAAGDFDGDGRSDLVGGGPKSGVSKPRVHFFDSSATPAPPVTLQVPMSSPVVSDFDRDGRADLAFAIGTTNFGGIGVFSGTADRTFSQRLFPVQTKPATDLRAVVIPRDPANKVIIPAGSVVFTLERDAGGTFFRTFSTGEILGIDQLEQAAPTGPEQVVGQLRRGRVFAPLELDPPSGCGDIVVPYNEGDAGRIAIVSPCTGTKDLFLWAPTRPILIRNLPGRVTGNTLVANLDGVGGDDIAVMTERGLAVAASFGGALSEFELLEPDAGASRAPDALAVGDLDLDGLTDIVAATGAYLSSLADAGDAGDAGAPSIELGQEVSIRPTAALWADAKVAMLNGDDLPDVVAFAPGALELEVHAGVDKRLFTRFAVPSSQPIRAVDVGDYDGDRIQDIAFLSSPLPLEDGSADTELLIAYGKSSGGPEAPRTIARFPRARGLATMHDATASVDHLLVIEVTAAADALPTTSMTFVFNDGDRQSIAPLIFRDDAAIERARESQARVWLPAAIVAGPFVTKEAVDVLAIAFGLTVNIPARNNPDSERLYALPFPTGTWFAKGSAAAAGGLEAFSETFRFGPDNVRAIDDSQFLEGSLQSLIVSAHADIDAVPDGVHEVVSIARTPGAETTDLIVVRPPELGVGGPPLIVRLSGFAARGEDELQLLDVDGDDLPDAVVLVRGDGRRPGSLRVYLNDGAGSFRPEAIVLESPIAEGMAPLDVEPVAFAQVVTGARADGKPRRELAVAGRGRLVLAELSPDRTRLVTRDLTSLLGLPLSKRITAIASGDWDGDGVEDLAIADSGAIRLLLQQPRLK